MHMEIAVSGIVAPDWYPLLSDERFELHGHLDEIAVCPVHTDPNPIVNREGYHELLFRQTPSYG